MLREPNILALDCIQEVADLPVVGQGEEAHPVRQLALPRLQPLRT